MIKALRTTPVHPHNVKAVSEGKKKNRLGDSRNGTSLTNSGTGSSPRSPSKGLNSLTTLRKPMRKSTPIDFSSANRASQYPPGCSHSVPFISGNILGCPLDQTQAPGGKRSQSIRTVGSEVRKRFPAALGSPS